MSNTTGFLTITAVDRAHPVGQFIHPDSRDVPHARLGLEQIGDMHSGISMDGRGRWMDNVFIERLWRSPKYECVYRNAF